MSKHFGKDTDELKRTLDDLRECGINRILYNAPINEIEGLLKYSGDLEIRIWKFILCNNDETQIKTHPDRFIINKLGQSCITNPAYVEYYKWLCPNHPEVLGYLKTSIKELCKISELKGIQLDYIRFPDVILPKGIQPQYNLNQTTEEPQYDYCYCANCRRKFKEKTGFDIIQDLEVREVQDYNTIWKQFRYDSITELVNNLSEFVHGFKKEISAAVFPTPQIAKTLVRQEWTKWTLDEVYPMIYHNHYEKSVSWIAEAIELGTMNTSAKLNAGLYLPAFPRDELKQAFEICRDSNASGFSLFSANSITNEHRKILKETC